MEGLPCFLNRKLDLKSSAPKIENREHILKTLILFLQTSEKGSHLHRYKVFTFSAIFSAGVLQSCSAAALLLFTTLLPAGVVLPSRWELMASASLRLAAASSPVLRGCALG